MEKNAATEGKEKQQPARSPSRRGSRRLSATPLPQKQRRKGKPAGEPVGYELPSELSKKSQVSSTSSSRGRTSTSAAVSSEKAKKTKARTREFESGRQLEVSFEQPHQERTLGAFFKREKPPLVLNVAESSVLYGSLFPGDRVVNQTKGADDDEQQPDGTKSEMGRRGPQVVRLFVDGPKRTMTTEECSQTFVQVYKPVGSGKVIKALHHRKLDGVGLVFVQKVLMPLRLDRRICKFDILKGVNNEMVGSLAEAKRLIKRSTEKHGQVRLDVDRPLTRQRRGEIKRLVFREEFKKGPASDVRTLCEHQLAVLHRRREAEDWNGKNQKNTSLQLERSQSMMPERHLPNRAKKGPRKVRLSLKPKVRFIGSDVVLSRFGKLKKYQSIPFRQDKLPIEKRKPRRGRNRKTEPPTRTARQPTTRGGRKKN